LGEAYRIEPAPADSSRPPHAPPRRIPLYRRVPAPLQLIGPRLEVLLAFQRSLLADAKGLIAVGVVALGRQVERLKVRVEQAIQCETGEHSVRLPNTLCPSKHH
jgi:hypothetical protein